MKNFNDSPIAVSIICKAYNHERYIRKTLEGFVSQRTDFRFEVLIHDDASTDNTAEIIREYEAKYPDIIKPTYQSENQYSRKTPVIRDFLLPRARGKYLAWCEGDDYWSDPQKLQLQVNAMENNENCSACFCRVEFVTFDTERRVRLAPEQNFPEQVMDRGMYFTHTLRDYFAWQISGLMVRKDVYNQYANNPPAYRYYFSKFNVGDIPLFLYIGLQGDIYYISRCMSCYRIGQPNNWTSRTKHNKDNAIAWYQAQSQGYEAFDQYSDYIYHEAVLQGIQRCQFSVAKINHDFKAMKGPELLSKYKELSKIERFKINVVHYFPYSLKIVSMFRHRGERY